MNSDKLAKINARLDKLIARLHQLETENTYLRQREAKLLSANRQLKEQQQQAENKIQSVLAYLKQLEANYEG